MIVQFRNEKVSNHGSIPITIDCNVMAFIVFEEGFHQPIKRTKQTWEVERGQFYDPVQSFCKSKNQQINRLQLALKLPWAIFFESVDILS
ncbi:hypothetical protein TNCV_3103291 [Trichonephila clavipes]|nr:hypothetical protein TNCV_3103291 [Trichonephila clavipes]